MDRLSAVKWNNKGLWFIGGLGLVYFLSKAINDMRLRHEWAQRRARKRLEKSAAKIQFAEYLRCHPMPKKRIQEIVSKSFAQLLGALRTSELTPEDVLLAYQHKAFEVDQRCNCVVEFLYPDFSLINFSGPFAGMPVSVKDNYRIKGHESYAGMSYFLTGSAEDDAVMISVLYSLGAVPFVRTSVPQAMLSVLSWNPIDGVTVNPLATDRSPGGSSSGEAALIGGGGSLLGFGTDLGGSIRLPAAMCNVVGFKPTPGRISQYKMLSLNRFMTTASSSGPLARDVNGCIEAMKYIWNSTVHHELDYGTPPLPYSFTPPDRKLRIGYFTYDGSYTAVPAAQRAVLHIKSLLESKGHELVHWLPPYTGRQWFEMFLTALFVDGGSSLVELLQYDEVDEPMARGLKVYKSTRFMRQIKWYLTRLFGHADDLLYMRAVNAVRDVPTLVAHMHALEDFQHRIYDSWRTAKLDAVICPSFGMAAPIPVRTTHKFSGMLTYLNLFNITNMPAGCLPSGIRVTEFDLAPLKSALKEEFPAPSKMTPSVYPIRSPWEKAAAELQIDTLGLPVSIQIAAAPWRDEMCLYVMQLIENAVRESASTETAVN